MSQYVDDPLWITRSLCSHVPLCYAFTLCLLTAGDSGEVSINELLSGFQGCSVDLSRQWTLLAWVQLLSCASQRRRRDWELLSNVVQDAARLDNIGLFVQRAFLRKAKLLQTPEAPLHVAKCRPHDVVDLCVGLIEANLVVVCRFWHRGQDMFAQVVAFTTFRGYTIQYN